MKVKLQVLQGKLQSRKGRDVGMVVEVHREKFVIGSGPDSNMRCVSRSISDQHCEIRIEGDHATIRDLGSETGTFLNDQRVDQPQVLRHGDGLRVGKLEFKVQLDAAADGRRKSTDEVADFVSDLLSEQDELDRARRLEDPTTRKYRPEPNAPPVAKEPAEPPAEEKKKPVRPPRNPPAKLPPPPPFVADNTIEAAEETLKKMFHK